MRSSRQGVPPGEGNPDPTVVAFRLQSLVVWGTTARPSLPMRSAQCTERMPPVRRGNRHHARRDDPDHHQSSLADVRSRLDPRQLPAGGRAGAAVDVATAIVMAMWAEPGAADSQHR